MKSVVFLFPLLLLGAGLVTAQPSDPLWTPAECPEEDFEHRLLLRTDAVRRAKVGQPMYTPHPVPTTGMQAVEIILDYLGRQLERQGRSIKMSESKANTKKLLELIARGQVRFEFYRVGQWRPKLRCNGPGSYARWYFLVRGFERDQGREVIRGAVDEFGLPASWLIRTGSWADDWMGGIEGLDAAAKRLGDIVGKGLRDVQYVEAAGSLGLNCSHLAPCIAARDDVENIYVLQVGDARRNAGLRLVHVPPGGPSATEHDLLEQPSLRNTPHGSTWVTVGGRFRLGNALSKTRQSQP